MEDFDREERLCTASRLSVLCSFLSALFRSRTICTSSSALRASNFIMRFSVFESRLRSIIDAVRSMNSLDLTVQWKNDLDAHDTEFWAKAISDGTTEKAKELLSRDQPPSRADLNTLDLILDDNFDPGMYLGFTEPTGDSLDPQSKAYAGSGTALGGGICKRTKQHSNDEYRENELKYVKLELTLYRPISQTHPIQLCTTVFSRFLYVSLYFVYVVLSSSGCCVKAYSIFFVSEFSWELDTS